MLYRHTVGALFSRMINTETFGLLVFPGMEELDLVGPWEMLRLWQRHYDGPGQCLLISQDGEPVRCAQGMVIHADRSFSDAPALDYLLVPGGEGTRREVNNPELVEFVRDRAAGCRYVLSVCTGALILHQAGLLSGRRATTYWGALDRLRATGDVEVVEERFVRDDTVWTSAGVSAGIDLTLALIAEVAGDRTAGEVQLAAEYFPAATRYGDACGRDEAPEYVKRR